MSVWPVALVTLLWSADPQVQRPAPPEAYGTGVIRGRVIAADTGGPIRNAVVLLTPIDGARTTTERRTDSLGNFAFTGLPAGRYRVQASEGRPLPVHLGMAFGGKEPSTPSLVDRGTPIEIADGESFDKAIVALPRGGVITGRVVDEHGEPMSSLQIHAMRMTGRSAAAKIPSSSPSDDLGQFRIYGLPPGDYLVVAETPAHRPATRVADEEAEANDAGDFLPTYFPSATDDARAQRVRVRHSAETPGLVIRMVSGRLCTVGGIVVDSKGRPLSRVSGALRGRSGDARLIGFSTDAYGRFDIRDVVPGEYQLTVYQQVERFEEGRVNTIGPGEFASVPVTVASDIEAMRIVTGTGATITGQVVFEPGTSEPPANGQPIRIEISALPARLDSSPGLPSPPPANVAPDLSFTMARVVGDRLLRARGGNYILKSVTADGVDVTDVPHEYRTGERVAIVLTRPRFSIVEGRVTDSNGASAAGARIVAFSDDVRAWRMDATRTKQAAADERGRYRLSVPIAGRYYVAAVPRERLNARGSDAEFFDELAREATVIVVGDGERRPLNLVIR